MALKPQLPRDRSPEEAARYAQDLKSAREMPHLWANGVDTASVGAPRTTPGLKTRSNSEDALKQRIAELEAKVQELEATVQELEAIVDPDAEDKVPAKAAPFILTESTIGKMTLDELEAYGKVFDPPVEFTEQDTRNIRAERILKEVAAALDKSPASKEE